MSTAINLCVVENLTYLLTSFWSAIGIRLCKNGRIFTSLVKKLNNQYSKIVKNISFRYLKESEDYLTFDTTKVTNPIVITHYKSILPTMPFQNKFFSGEFKLPLQETRSILTRNHVGLSCPS